MHSEETMFAFAEEVEKIASVMGRVRKFFGGTQRAPISRAELSSIGKSMGAGRYVPFTKTHRRWDRVKKQFRKGERARKSGARAMLDNATKNLSSMDPRVRARARSDTQAARRELRGPVGNLIARMRGKRAPKPNPTATKAKLIAGGAAAGAGGLLGAQIYAANKASDPYRQYR